jgi:hypothetical protein
MAETKHQIEAEDLREAFNSYDDEATLDAAVEGFLNEFTGEALQAGYDRALEGLSRVVQATLAGESRDTAIALSAWFDGFATARNLGNSDE